MSDGAKESVELLPCPFCGLSDLVLTEREPRHWRAILCNECGARGPSIKLEEWQIKEDWNCRATPPAAPAGGESEAMRADILDALDWLEDSARIKVNGFIPREVTMHNEMAAAQAERIRLALFAISAAPAQSIEDEREAAIDRIMSIRNGMTPDVEARAIVRRELAALAALKDAQS